MMSRAGAGMAEKAKALFWPGLTALVMFAVLAGLGTWQLQRLEWKETLIERLETRLAERPVPLPGQMAQPDEWEFRPVLFRGRPLTGYHFPVFRTGPRGGPGYAIYRPFVQAGGTAVFVNTGWISQRAYRAEGPPPVPQPQGAFTAIIRMPAGKGLFTPDNRPGENLWYWADLTAMAGAAGLERWMPVTLWLVPEGARPGEPGFPVRVDLPNNHLQYAITWFSLAFFLAVIFILFAYRQRRFA